MPDVTTAATYTERLATVRLLHRFSFGPTPGQYAALVKRGVPRAQAAVLARNGNDPGLVFLVPPTLPDIGFRPPPETAAEATFQSEINQGSTALVNWWLDRMTLAHYPLAERMTWFGTVTGLRRSRRSSTHCPCRYGTTRCAPTPRRVLRDVVRTLENLVTGRLTWAAKSPSTSYRFSSCRSPSAKPAMCLLSAGQNVRAAEFGHPSVRLPRPVPKSGGRSESLSAETLIQRPVVALY